MSASTTTQFATEQGVRLLRGVTTQINRTIRSPGIDEVHDLRVAIRRFMRVLAVLKPCYPRGESRRIRRGLKRIMAQAGSVRDKDIAMRLLARLEAPRSGPLAHRFREQREEAAATLSASLRRWTERNLPAAWRKAFETGEKPKGGDARFGAAPAGALAKRMLPVMAAEHFRRGKEAAREDAGVEEIHRFRIAAKNLRYTLDLFAPLYGTSLAGLLEQLRDVQALLGDINDCATVRRMVSRERVPSRGNGEDAAAKEVLAALKRRQRKKTEQFRQHYTAEFSSTATLRQWKESLRAAGGAARSTRKAASKRAAARGPHGPY